MHNNQKIEKKVTLLRNPNGNEIKSHTPSFHRDTAISLLIIIMTTRILSIFAAPKIVSYSPELFYQSIFTVALGIFGAYGILRRNRMIIFFALVAIVSEIFMNLNLMALYIINGLTTYALVTAFFSVVVCSLALFFTYSYGSLLKQQTQDKLHLIFSEPKTQYAVELYDVVKDYHVGPVTVHALRGVTMKIKRGEFVAIMGPSGSGKSTLLNLIGAIDRPTSGKILIDGINISMLNDNELAHLRNKKIGFIFQAYNLINRTTVLRNVELPAIVAGLSRKERIKKAKKMLEIVGLVDEIHRRPNYLSGGQQQRVAIARALINDPSIILADEPTGNLDSKTGREIMEYLRKLNEEFGTTVIVVTHDREIAEMADRILHIRDGKIIGEEIIRGEKE